MTTAETAASPASASVVTPHVIMMRSPPIAATGVAQVHHRMEISGRIVGVRCAGRGRVARILTDSGTATRKTDSAQSWPEILRSQPLIFRTGQFVILVVSNESADTKAFEVEVEVEEDPSLATVDAPTVRTGVAARANTRANTGAVSAAVPSGRRNGNASPMPGSPLLPRGGASAPAMPSQRRSTASKAYLRNPPVRTEPRSDKDILYVVLDGILRDRLVRSLTAQTPLASADLVRITGALDQARARRDPPNTAKTDIVVKLTYDLFTRLDVTVRRGVRGSSDVVAEIVRHLKNMPSPEQGEDRTDQPVETRSGSPLPFDDVAAAACASALDAYAARTEPPVGSDPSFWNGVRHAAKWLREQSASPPALLEANSDRSYAIAAEVVEDQSPDLGEHP